MSDEGMDPCECIWNHELAMRRLLSLLRQGQAYCNDLECETTEVPQAAPQAAGDSFMTVFLVMALAVALFVLRPRRARRLEAAKPAPHSPDNDGAPPTPPRI